MSLGSKNAHYPWHPLRPTGTTSEPRRGHAQRVRPCPRSRSGVAACNAAECQGYADLQVHEVAARLARVSVFTLTPMLAGLMEIGFVVVCSLFSRLSDSVEARDQHAGAASSRPGVRRPPLLARKPCTLPRTYSPDLTHPSAGRGCTGDGLRAQRAPEMARDRGPGEHVCGMASPEAVLGRVRSDLHVVCSARTPVSAGELNM